MKKNEMTIRQQAFNGRVGEYLQGKLKKSESINIFRAMLDINELYAQSYGHYAEKDEEWIDQLCYELLKVIEDYAWMQFPAEEKEAQDLLCYMSICELSAVRVC